MRGPQPRQNRGVARCRFRDRVVLVAIRKDGAFVRQLEQAARQLALPAREIIGTELIDGNHHDELRTGWRSGARVERQGPREEREHDGEVHGQKVAGQAVAATGSCGPSRKSRRPPPATTTAGNIKRAPGSEFMQTKNAPPGPTKATNPRPGFLPPITK